MIHNPKTAGIAMKQALGIPMIPNTAHKNPAFYRKRFPKKWNDYFKFIFIRHPLDRFVSAYYFNVVMCRYREQTNPVNKIFANNNFDEFLSWCAGKPKSFFNRWLIHFKPQMYWMKYDDTKDYVNYNFVGHYERLLQDFEALCKAVGMQPRRLPIQNKTDHKNYMDYYTVKTAAIVRNIYHEDFLYLGYK